MSGDERDPEQKASDDALLEAIQHRMRLQSRTPGPASEEEIAESAGEVVTEYIVVAHVTSIDLVESNSSRYAYMTLDSGVGPHSAPPHHLEGLLRRALDWLNRTEPEDFP